MLRIADRRAATLIILILVAAMSCLPACWPAAPAEAAEPAAATGAAAPAASPADRAQAEELVKTLEDPQARAKLVGQLKLLAAAQPAPKPALPPPAAGVLVALSQALQQVSDELLATATAIGDIDATSASDWMREQISSPQIRERWWRILGRLVVVIAGGMLVEWILWRVLAAPRRMLDGIEPSNPWLRLPLAIGRWVLDLIPIGAFAGTGFSVLALPFYRPGGHSELVSVVVITAYATARAATTFAEAILRPDAAANRPVRLGDERAKRLHGWARRIINTGVWGYYGDQVLELLGMPYSGYDFLLKLLGIVLVVMLVMLVLEFRRPVAAWIGGRDRSSGIHGQKFQIEERVEGARNWLAGAWHVLAMLYVVAAYVIWALRVSGGFEFLLRASVLTALIIVVARLIGTVWQRLVDRAFGLGPPSPYRFPQLEARRRRYHPFARRIGSVVIAILAVLAVCQAWGAGTLEWLTSDAGHALLGTIAAIAATIIGALFIWEVVNAAIERYLAQTDSQDGRMLRGSRARTLLPLVRNAFTILLVLVAALIVLGQVGVNIAPLLAGAGVIGVAIGFGSQKLVQDVITGAFILFEDTIAVGDVVTIADHSGVVEGLTIRTIRLRSASGDLHTLPFSSVSTVVNMSRDYAYSLFNIGVSYREDTDHVMEVMRQVYEEMRTDKVWGGQLAEPIELWGVDRFAESAVVISGRIKTAPNKSSDVGREFNRRIKKRFDELGIEMPYRTTTLMLGADRDGRPQSVSVKIESDRPAPPDRTPPAEPGTGRIQVAGGTDKGVA